jgi:transposase
MGNDKLTIEKVEEMFDTYVEHQSARQVSARCGVHYNTARKYIREGDQARGIEPFEQRCTRITKLAARRVEKRITYARADATAAAWQHLQLLDDVIIEALLRYRETIADGKPRLGDIVQAVKVSNELKTRLEKWSDDKDDAGNQRGALPKGIAELTITELEIFATTGTVPVNRIAIPPGAAADRDALLDGGVLPATTAEADPTEADDPDAIEPDEVIDPPGLTAAAVAAVVGADATPVDTVPGWLEPED